MKDTGRVGRRRGTGLKKKDEAENARLCRETAVLGGDAAARAKVGSEGGVEGGGEDGRIREGGAGVRDRFLKDASRGTCCAPRGGGAWRKSTVRGLWKETIAPWGRRGNSPGVAGER